MADDAHKQLQERLARVAEKATATLHEIGPDLRGKTVKETVIILKEKEEERQTRCQRPDFEIT